MLTIDILMATYNGERYVREQIKSIQAQTFKDWRLLVSDDCSIDKTLEIVRDIALNDSRIEIVSDGVRHGSAKANFMSLLERSAAPYVMFCDQDDVWLPEKVEITLHRMIELERIDSSTVPLLVFTDMKVVDANLKVIHESFERSSNIDPRRTEFRQLLAQSVGAGCTMMVNRSAVEFAMKADNADALIMHDWWMSLVCSAFGAIDYIDRPTSLYRQHGDNEVGAESFNVLSWLGKFDEMTERQILSCVQAGFFAKTYEGLLDTKQLEITRRCALICSKNAASNLWNLIRSGAWKSGLRKFGQVIAAMKGGSRAMLYVPKSETEGYIVAGIVTYNPNMERLKENIEAVIGQVSKLIIFDNGSNNINDVELLAKELCDSILIKNDENFGMAVALNAIAGAALSLGASDVLLLDQDSVVSPCFVERLKAWRAPEVGIVCPLIVDRNVEATDADTFAVCKVKRAITSGSLVNLPAWKAIGGYDERLFVDWVDNEYCDNLRSNGYSIVKVNAAVLLHEMGKQEYAWNAPGKDYTDVAHLSRGYYRQNYPAWRWEDRARSQAITIKKYKRSRIGLEERFLFIKSTVGRVLLLERNKRAILQSIIAGYRRGIESGDY